MWCSEIYEVGRIQAQIKRGGKIVRNKGFLSNTLSQTFSVYTKKKLFFGFSMGRNQYWAGRVYDLCVYYMTGTPEGSTESGFMEKPGFEPATPGLQGIALNHYPTGASLTLSD